jgi:AcrR family transcriptional regulator
VTSDAPPSGSRPAGRARRPGPAPDPDQREALLRAAADLLATEGPEALTVRRIAAAAGCSTMGVYSRFGGKDGIVEALFVEGFEGLRAAMSAEAPTDDPWRDLVHCGLAYRVFALSHRTSYLVMFERVVADFVPSDSAVLTGMATFTTLVAKVERCLARLDDDGHGHVALEIAHGLWAASHGWVSLELHGLGWLGDRQDAAYEAAMGRLVDTLRT